MRLSQAFAAKEEMTRQELISAFSDDDETVRRINEAFKRGKQAWQSHLTHIYGKKEAERFFKILEEIRFESANSRSANGEVISHISNLTVAGFVAVCVLGLLAIAAAIWRVFKLW